MPQLCFPRSREAQLGHSLLTASFAAFVLVLFRHSIRRVFPIDESHAGSFPLVSIRSLKVKRLPRSLDARIKFQLNTTMHYHNDTTMIRTLPPHLHLHPQKTKYTRSDQGPRPEFGMIAWRPRFRVSPVQGANHTATLPTARRSSTVSSCATAWSISHRPRRYTTSFVLQIPACPRSGTPRNVRRQRVKAFLCARRSAVCRSSSSRQRRRYKQ